MRIDQAKSEYHYSTADVLIVVENARRGFKGFRFLPKDNCTSAEFTAMGRIKDLWLPQELKITSVDYVAGTVEGLADPIEQMRLMLLSGPAAFGESFTVKAFLQPTNAQPEREEYDGCGVMKWRGKVWVTYRCSARSSEHREARFTDIFASSSLPARLREEPNGFSIEHSSNGLLREVEIESNGSNPFAIWCEIPNGTVEQALDIAQPILLGSPIVAIEWNIVPHEDQIMTLDFLASHELPCEKFDINFSYSLRDLNILEELMRVNITSGFFATEIATFKVRGQRALLSVRTDPQGHVIYVENIDPYLVLGEINQKLGLPLVPDDQL